jgi:hypothetical protein
MSYYTQKLGPEIFPSLNSDLGNITSATVYNFPLVSPTPNQHLILTYITSSRLELLTILIQVSSRIFGRAYFSNGKKNQNMVRHILFNFTRANSKLIIYHTIHLCIGQHISTNAAGSDIKWKMHDSVTSSLKCTNNI